MRRRDVWKNSTYFTKEYADSTFHPAAVLRGRMISEQRVGKDFEGKGIGIFLEWLKKFPKTCQKLASGYK
jgi:hypothetical protein